MTCVGEGRQEKRERADTGMRLKPGCISKWWKGDPTSGADSPDDAGGIPTLRVNFPSFRSKSAHPSGKLPGGENVGVFGSSTSNTGILGRSETGVGIEGQGGRLAGLFSGDVHVKGQLVVGGTDILGDTGTNILDYIHKLEARIRHLEFVSDFLAGPNLFIGGRAPDLLTIRGEHFSPLGQVDITITPATRNKGGLDFSLSLTTQCFDNGTFNADIPDFVNRLAEIHVFVSDPFGAGITVEAKDVASGLTDAASLSEAAPQDVFRDIKGKG